MYGAYSGAVFAKQTASEVRPPALATYVSTCQHGSRASPVRSVCCVTLASSAQSASACRGSRLHRQCPRRPYSPDSASTQSRRSAAAERCTSWFFRTHRSMREYRRPSRDWRWVAETPLGWGINGSMHRLGWVMCPLTSIRNAHATFFLLNSPSTSLSIDCSSRISVDRLWGAYNTKREGLLFGRSSL
jgi:hypothetical protein